LLVFFLSAADFVEFIVDLSGGLPDFLGRHACFRTLTEVCRRLLQGERQKLPPVR
jgi:hypothetical protein